MYLKIHPNGYGLSMVGICFYDQAIAILKPYSYWYITIMQLLTIGLLSIGYNALAITVQHGTTHFTKSSWNPRPSGVPHHGSVVLWDPWVKATGRCAKPMADPDLAMLWSRLGRRLRCARGSLALRRSLFFNARSKSSASQGFEFYVLISRDLFWSLALGFFLFLKLCLQLNYLA